MNDRPARGQRNQDPDFVAPNTVTRDFYRVAMLGSALSFGILGATLQSLHGSPTGFGFTMDHGTLIAFVAGSCLGLLYWHWVSYNARISRLASAMLALAGIAMFLYPLRFIPTDKLPETAEGLLVAVVALGGAGSLVYMAGKFFGAEDKGK
jgi:hypothetical protein